MIASHTTAYLSLTRLYQLHASDLNAYLRHRLGCPALADDLCQETFLRLSQRPYDEHLEEPRAYLFSTAKNLIIDHFRRRQSRIDHQQLDDPHLCLTCPLASPETAADRALCYRHLRRAMSSLPPRLNQALTWHRLEGVTQAEIGRRLGVSERMAGRYIAQALEQCRGTLAGTISPSQE